MAFLRRPNADQGDEDGPPVLHVWEAASLAEVFRVQLPEGVSSFAVPPDGRRLVLGHSDTSLTLHDWSWDTAAEPRGS
jgi:hypothetical protein